MRRPRRPNTPAQAESRGQAPTSDDRRDELPADIIPDRALVFMHVPKCGGTTIHDWMLEHVHPGIVCPERHRLPAEPPPAQRAALGHFRVFSGHFDIVDADNFPRPQRRFTILRDPVDRIVSLYDFWRAHDPDYVDHHDLVGPRLARSMTFDDFARGDDPRIIHDLDNTYVRTFTGLIRTSARFAVPGRALDAAVATVDSLDHVGHLDRIGETFAWVGGVLGLPEHAVPTGDRRDNTRGEWTAEHLRNVERTVPSPDALAALEPLVELDRQLVERCTHQRA